jgi:type III secretion protein L
MGLAFLITSERLQLLSERKVLKEAEYAALLDASAMLDTARDEARRIVQHAKDQAEDVRRQGYEAGLREATSRQAERALDAAAESAAQMQGLRETVARLVVKAVNQCLTETDPATLFEGALRKVDALIRAEPFLTVHVSPVHEKTVRSLVQRLRDEAQWTMVITVQADPALPEGGCVLITPAGAIDIGLDAQLDAFTRVLRRGTHV